MASGGSSAGDTPGSQDPAGFKRFQGSRILHYFTSSYDEYKLNRDDDWGKTQTVAGAVTRVVYLVPPGSSALEVFLNYEQMLAGAGFHQTFELKSDKLTAQNFIYGVLGAAPETRTLYDAFGTDTVGGPPADYTTYQSSVGGRDVNVAVYVSTSNRDLTWGAPDFKTPVPISRGQVIVVFDVVGAKTISNKMVVVKAADIADALATKGVFDLYGVYFDTDKTDVKSESTATLDEVASLLKIDRSLKLEVSGHTDNTGAKDHNLKLSQGRAQAVVAVLVGKYGIDAKRLIAKGYGDTKPVAPNDNDADKAKNRRVELRKI